MSYVKQLIRGNRPAQNSDYESMLQDLDTVTQTSSKQWGARGEPTRTTSYADRERGKRDTQKADNERRLANQKAAGEVAAKGDQRRTSMQLGIDAAIADREQRSAEREEEGRQTRLGHEQQMKEITQNTEIDWRETAFQEYKSKMTNMDRLAMVANDTKMKEMEVELREQHAFSMQDIDQNMRYQLNILNEDIKKWRQDKEISFDELKRRMETAAENTAQTTQGVIEVAGEFIKKIFSGGDEE